MSPMLWFSETGMLDDSMIIDLYWARSENAIAETRIKYGRLCRAVALRILRVAEDAEECEADTYMKAWNAMPPRRPDVFPAFLAKITRNLSLDRLEKEHAGKRGGSAVPLLLDELEQCIPDGRGGLEQVTDPDLKEVLDHFLESQAKTARIIFVRRYWFGDSVKEIAEEYGLGISRVKMSLLRSRNALKKMLEAEGIGI